MIGGTADHRLGDPALAVACDIAGDFATTGGVTNMDGIAKIEVLGDCGRVSSIMIHVMAVRHLA